MTDTSAPDEPQVPDVHSRASFRHAIVWAAALANESKARHMWWVDPDFSEWPLDDPNLLQSIAQWARLPQRRLFVLAGSFDAFASRHPRFTAWRRSWSHVVDTRAVAEDDCPSIPSWLLVEHAGHVELIDRAHWRGRAGLDARRTHTMVEEIDALAQRSSPDFPVSRLGL